MYVYQHTISASWLDIINRKEVSGHAILTHLNASCKIICMKPTKVSRERLINICTRLGYPISSRKLTDWVRKGLLPPLEQHGRGQGMGKEYFWPGQSVIAQAVVVSEYLSWTNRSDDALLLTWFAGYPVPLNQVRRIWARRQAGNNSAVTQKFPDSFELQEWIRRGIQREGKKLGKPFPLSLATSMYTALLTNDFETIDGLSPADERRLNEEVANFLNESGGGSSAVKGTVLTKKGLDFIHRNLSPAQRQRLIESATAQDLLEAQRDWRVTTGFMATILRYAIRAANHIEPVGIRDLARWRRHWGHLIGNLGGSLILLDLALRQSGYRDAINASLMAFIQVNEKIRWTREIPWMLRHREISPGIIQAMPDVLEALSPVWQPFFD